MDETNSFHQYASILASARQSDSNERLDSEIGIANAFSTLCRSRSQNATDLAKEQAILNNHGRLDHIDINDLDDDSGFWKGESQTWRLIAMLSSERAQRARYQNNPTSSSSTSTYLDPYQTPISKVQEILENSTSLSELYTLRNWLSSILPPSVNLEIRKGYKTFSKNRVRNDKRISTNNGSQAKNQPRKSNANGRGGISGVSNLDPDAESRKEGSWEVEDKTYEKALVKALFEYTRSGNLVDALDLSRKVDQSWRSASLSGGMMYYQPGLSFKSKRRNQSQRSQNRDQDEQEDEDDEFGQDDLMMNVEEERESLGDKEFGNRNRMLWKGVCRKLAATNSLDPYERALYGSLCGDITSVLNVSSDWISYLWAYVNHSLETLIDSRLDSSNDGNFNWWSQNAFDGFSNSSLSSVTTEFGSIKVLDLKVQNHINVEFEKQLDREGEGKGDVDSIIGYEIMKDIFAKLRTSTKEEIRVEANDPLHQVEEHFIFDEIHSFLNTTVDPLKRKASEVIQGTEEYYQYVKGVRFLTHLIIFLRLINYTSRSKIEIERPESSLDASALWQRTINDMVILYIDILKAEKQDDLVAMYATELQDESATDQYAQYLISLDLNTSLETRRSALLKAQEHGLSVAAVASKAVDFSFLQNLPSIPLPDHLPILPQLTNTSLTYSEESLIKSLSWLSFDIETHLHLLLKANQLIRRFFARGNLLAVRKILESLPKELAAVGNLLEIPKGQLEQFQQFESYFLAIDSYGFYKETWAKRPSNSASRVDKYNWEKLILNTIEKTQILFTEILELNWLKFGDEIDLENSDEYMLEELSIIRRNFIPELVMTLHVMLFESSEVFPENLTKALQIANLVADERYKLYLDFLTPDAKENRLRDYLEQVRLAELRSLELSSDPFKYA